jgi:peroxiredoxin Q/BCP
MAAKKQGKAKARSAKRAPAAKAPARSALSRGARAPQPASKKTKKAKSRKTASAGGASAARPAAKKAVRASGAKKAPRASQPFKKAITPEATTSLAVGDVAPPFELTDHAGKQLSSAELAGSPYVIYFYPKDDTPGCTIEACGFRDSAAAFDELGVRVIGVSPDSVSSHQRFIAKYGLPFSLLSDDGQRLASAYGVWSLKKNYGREYMGIVRSTFLVDGSGVIRKSWRGVRVKGHVDEVQAAAQALN